MSAPTYVVRPKKGKHSEAKEALGIGAARELAWEMSDRLDVPVEVVDSEGTVVYVII